MESLVRWFVATEGKIVMFNVDEGGDEVFTCPFPQMAVGLLCVFCVHLNLNFAFSFNFLMLKSVATTLASPWKIPFFLFVKKREDRWRMYVRANACLIFISSFSSLILNAIFFEKEYMIWMSECVWFFC